jgi:broad specificity phosphatase PhoE
LDNSPNGTMARIILARHGQTAWNVDKIFRGRSEVGLDDVGTKQAELLGRYLGSFKLEAIYSSPLKRALHTANIIAGYQKVGVQVAQGLTDLDFGEWQSLPEQEVRRQYPALLDEWHNNPGKVRIPGGESLEDVRARAIEVMNDVVSRYEGNVLLVSHRVVVKVLICSLLGLDNSGFWSISQDVGAITVFDHSAGRFVLTRHNDTCHLRALQESGLDDI